MHSLPGLPEQSSLWEELRAEQASMTEMQKPLFLPRQTPDTKSIISTVVLILNLRSTIMLKVEHLLLRSKLAVKTIYFMSDSRRKPVRLG